MVAQATHLAIMEQETWTVLQNPPPELLLTSSRLRQGKGGTSSRHILAGCRSTFLASTAKRKPKNGLRANVRRGLERGATRREAAPDHAYVHFSSLRYPHRHRPTGSPPARTRIAARIAVAADISAAPPEDR